MIMVMLIIQASGCNPFVNVFLMPILQVPRALLGNLGQEWSKERGDVGNASE